MTRSQWPTFLFLALVSPLAFPTLSSGSTATITVLLGPKLLDDTWVTQDQAGIAVDAMWGRRNWPALLTTYVSASSGKGRNSLWTDVRESVQEAGIGLTKSWMTGSFHPRLGAGVSRIWEKTHIEKSVDSEDRRFEETGMRPWVAWGGSWSVGSGFELGAAVRASELGHTNVSLGGWHVGLTIGRRWSNSN